MGDCQHEGEIYRGSSIGGGDNYYCAECKAGMGLAYYRAAIQRDRLAEELHMIRERIRHFEHGETTFEAVGRLQRERDDLFARLSRMCGGA